MARGTWIAPVENATITAAFENSAFVVTRYENDAPPEQLARVTLTSIPVGGGIFTHREEWWTVTGGVHDRTPVTVFIAGTARTTANMSTVPHRAGRGEKLVPIAATAPGAFTTFKNENGDLEIVAMNTKGITNSWTFPDPDNDTFTSSSWVALRLADQRIALASIEGRQLDRVVLRLLDERTGEHTTRIVSREPLHYGISIDALGNRLAIATSDLHTLRHIRVSIVDIAGEDSVTSRLASVETGTVSRAYPPIVRAAGDEFVVAWVDHVNGVAQLHLRSLDASGHPGAILTITDAIDVTDDHAHVDLSTTDQGLSLSWPEAGAIRRLSLPTPIGSVTRWLGPFAKWCAKGASTPDDQQTSGR